MKRLFSLIWIPTAILAVAGCGGQIAKTGCVAVKSVTCQGVMTLQYADGRVGVKRIVPDNLPKDLKEAEKNLLKPARYVETVKGSTLTFPCGETLIYQDTECR